MLYKFTTADSPQANGRKPRKGERGYKLQMRLDDNGKLILHVGERGLRTLFDLIGERLLKTT